MWFLTQVYGRSDASEPTSLITTKDLGKKKVQKREYEGKNIQSETLILQISRHINKYHFQWTKPERRFAVELMRRLKTMTNTVSPLYFLRVFCVGESEMKQDVLFCFLIRQCSQFIPNTFLNLLISRLLVCTKTMKFWKK